ncbi:MAG: DUF2802 domain-containing protein [Desulfofustis sp.]|nr:DUF2802 domain-containing protein [Desulfofustis sp.]
MQIAWFMGGALAALLIYELIAVLPLRRRVAQLARSHAAIEQGHETITRLTIRQVNNERRYAQQFTRLEDRLGRIELRGEGRPYEQAITLAAQGEDVGRLVSCFGLTAGEASLVSLLHGGPRSDEPPGQ